MFFFFFGREVKSKGEKEKEAKGLTANGFFVLLVFFFFASLPAFLF